MIATRNMKVQSFLTQCGDCTSVPNVQCLVQQRQSEARRNVGDSSIGWQQPPPGTAHRQIVHTDRPVAVTESVTTVTTVCTHAATVWKLSFKKEVSMKVKDNKEYWMSQHCINVIVMLQCCQNIAKHWDNLAVAGL